MTRKHRLKQQPTPFGPVKMAYCGQRNPRFLVMEWDEVDCCNCRRIAKEKGVLK